MKRKIESKKSPAFSESHADAAVNFFELVLKHSNGLPFLLTPQQEDTVRAVFGYPGTAETKLVQVLSTEVVKAGSGDFAAGLVLLALTVYPKSRAGNVYRAACKMVEQSPILKRSFDA